jgi:hypothetical protein
LPCSAVKKSAAQKPRLRLNNRYASFDTPAARAPQDKIIS